MKLFNKWDTSQIVIEDPGLKSYINISPILVPKTGGKNTVVRFWKNKTTIVERLMNKLMVPGHAGKKHKLTSKTCSGKSQTVYKIVFKTLEQLEAQTKKNPVEVLVKAIENAAPREEITTIEYGGARYPQAVECSPQRRIDIVLKHMTQGAYQKSFGKKKSMVSALTEEIMGAYNFDNQKSNAVAKKLETERQADASR
ncbi:MAG TPA: 30S ribosomal protein S7 [Candidatus Nanoarchaeia archaeon]|nr:30S ribosomal protein S7 [Candidatus Nanoarchaeia archaeon]